MNTGIAWIFRVPLFRLLAINLAIGIAVALLMIGGLLAINPYVLRDLIAADRASGVSIVLLTFGFVVTFGSTAMGTAIMAIGRSEGPRGGKRAPTASGEPAPVKVTARRQ